MALKTMAQIGLTNFCEALSDIRAELVRPCSCDSNVAEDIHGSAHTVVDRSVGSNEFFLLRPGRTASTENIRGALTIIGTNDIEGSTYDRQVASQ